jgi:uncharacterized membrane protein YhaH (DUF805 family)
MFRILPDRWNPFVVERHVWHTRLPPDQCAARLRRVTRPYTVFPNPYTYPIPDKPVMGTVEEASFTLYKDEGPSQNSFRMRARGPITPAPDGAYVHVELSLHPFVGWFHIVYVTFGLLFAALVLGALIVHRMRGASGSGPPVVLVGIPIALKIYAIFLYRLGYDQARSERLFLLSFLQTTLSTAD